MENVYRSIGRGDRRVRKKGGLSVRERGKNDKTNKNWRYCLRYQYGIRKEFGKGRVKVHVTFDGIPYDGSICYIIGMLKSIRNELGKSGGDFVEVTVRER